MSEFEFENEGMPRIIRAPASLGDYQKSSLFDHVSMRSVVMARGACEYGCRMHLLVITSPELWADEGDERPQEYGVEDFKQELMKNGEGWFVVVKNGRYAPLIK